MKFKHKSFEAVLFEEHRRHREIAENELAKSTSKLLKNKSEREIVIKIIEDGK